MKNFKLFVISAFLTISLSASAAPVPQAPSATLTPQQITKPNNINLTEMSKPMESSEKATTAELSEIREQARFLYNTNNINEAFALIKSIKENEKNSDDWLYMANISQDLGKIDDAVLYLKKSLEVDDKNYKAHYNLGNIYFEEKQYNAALNEYRKVLKIKKDFAFAHYNKGCCYLAKNSLINARYEFGLAIKSNPEEPSFYYNLAYTNKLLKKDKKAQEALDVYNQLMAK